MRRTAIVLTGPRPLLWLRAPLAWRASALLAGLALAACGQGSFTVHFSWADEPPADTAQLYLSASLQAWPEGDPARAVTLATAGPIQGGQDQTLTFADLAYGDGRVVLAEVRASTDERERVLYRGRSELFDLTPGRQTQVTVALGLAPTPGTDAASDAQVLIEVGGQARETVNTGVVDLSLPLAGAARVRVANDPAFSAGVAERDGAALQAVTGGRARWRDWDLNVGLPAALAARDGQRTVFVVLYDELGYPSPVLRAAVQLDTAPPLATTATLTYQSGAGSLCPLRADELRAAQPATLVTVAFTVSEPLGAQPVVFVGDPLSPNLRSFALDLEASTDSSWVARKTINVANEWLLEPGSHPVRVQLTDLAGNSNAPEGQVLPTAPLLVRDHMPGMLVEQAALTYWRAPYGMRDRASAYFELGSASGPLPLVGAGGSPPGQLGVLPWSTFSLGGTAPVAVGVYVAEAPDAAGQPYRQGAELGLLRLADNGQWPALALRQLDAPQVMVVGYDDACLASWGVPIERSAWVVSPRARAGQVVQALYAVADAEEPAASADRQLVGPLGSTGDYALLDDGPAPRVTTGPRWRPLPAGQAWPSGRRRHELVYDSRRGRLVLAGGITRSNASALQVHEWDGERWLQADGVALSRLSSRDRYGAYFDQGLGVLVLLPGWVAYDGARLTALPSPYPTGPGDTMHLAAYDARRGQVVMLELGSATGATWTWDGLAWQAHPGPEPHPDDGAALVYDAARGMVLLFGGHLPGRTTLLGETWGFDGMTWQLLADEAQGPGARSGHALAYDSRRERVVLFGGCGSFSAGTWYCNALRDDTWLWDGTSWSPAPAAGAPAPRLWHAMAYDARQGLTSLFGGQGVSEQVYGDLWTFDGEGWRRQPADQRLIDEDLYYPGVALVHDPLRAQDLALLGRRNPEQQRSYVGEGGSWRVVGAAAALHWGPLVYDPASQRVLLVSETDSSYTRPTRTWAWEGTSWVDTGALLPPLQDIGVAATASGVLLFGGRGEDTVTSGLVWHWDGDSWGPLGVTGAQPAPRWQPRLGADALGRTWLHGGGIGSPSDPQYYEDTWRWDGASWTELTPAGVSGAPRNCPGLVGTQPVLCNYSAGLVPLGTDSMLLVGPGRAWLWDGASWVRLPGAIGGEALITGYDSAALAAPALGVEIGLLNLDTEQAYAWDFPPPRAPAARWTLDLAGAGVDWAAIDGLELSYAAVASYDPYGPDDHQAVLQGWATRGPAAGSWTTLAASAQTCWTYNPRPCAVWQANDAAEARTLVATQLGQLVFQLRPLGGSGPAGRAAALELDAIEARVYYRLAE